MAYKVSNFEFRKFLLGVQLCVQTLVNVLWGRSIEQVRLPDKRGILETHGPVSTLLFPFASCSSSDKNRILLYFPSLKWEEE